MRLKKVFFFIIIILSLLLATVFFTRSSLIMFSVNQFLNSDDTNISCLDFNVDHQLNITVSKLCLTTPVAELTLLDALIDWQFDSTSPIKTIDVKQLDIYGTQTFLKTGKTDNSSTPLSIEALFTHLDQLANINVPFQLTIEQYTYQPYTSQNLTNKYRYLGDLKLKNNNLMVNFMSNAKTNILAATLTTNQKELSGHFEVNLPEIISLLAIHQLHLPTTMQAFNINQGILKSSFFWQQQELSLQSSLTEFACHCTFSTAPQLTTNILADLQWQSIITKTAIQHVWQENSQINLTYQEQALIELLQAHNAPQDLIAIFNHNQQQQINIIPGQNIHFNFAQQQLFIAELNIDMPNKSLTNRFSFANLYLQPSENTFVIPVILQAEYQFNSQLIIPTLSKLMAQPIMVNASGNIEKSTEKFTINVNKSTTTASNVTINTNNDNTIKVKAAKIDNEFSGSINLKAQSKPRLSFTIDTRITPLYINNVAKVNNLTFNSKFDGELADFVFSSQITADNLPLAQANISGVKDKINFSLQASQLALTNLLSLNISPPIEVELIDGVLNYNINGTMIDFAASSLVADIQLSVNDLTGEIDGTWVQGVNWEQKLHFSNSELITPLNSNNVFSVDVVETPTPITSLSAQTNISYIANELHADISNIQASILGGSFKVAKVTWPMPSVYSANIQLTDIDLEQVLALDKKQGIVVTGRISGELPLTLNNDKLMMSAGKLHNSTPGLIQVMNNPAVEELKAQNSQLKLAFDALQNLHYHQLSSEVSMIDDGYMLLETVIKGKNPDLDNDVNLNLNLSYDLLGLLESLSITERFEKSIVESLNKP